MFFYSANAILAQLYTAAHQLSSVREEEQNDFSVVLKSSVPAEAPEFLIRGHSYH